GGADPARIGVKADQVEKIYDVLREADTDGHVADGVFEDQIPADDPRDDFAHRGVGVGVSAAGDGDHGSELGVADGGKAAGDGDENEGNGDGGTCAWATERCSVVNEVIEKRGIEDGRRGKFLAGDGGANNGKNARTDDSADAERGEA